MCFLLLLRLSKGTYGKKSKNSEKKENHANQPRFVFFTSVCPVPKAQVCVCQGGEANFLLIFPPSFLSLFNEPAGFTQLISC